MSADETGGRGWNRAERQAGAVLAGGAELVRLPGDAGTGQRRLEMETNAQQRARYQRKLRSSGKPVIPCLEDECPKLGYAFRDLGWHLQSVHGMTGRQYLIKFSVQLGKQLSTKELCEMRRQAGLRNWVRVKGGPNGAQMRGRKNGEQTKETRAKILETRRLRPRSAAQIAHWDNWIKDEANKPIRAERAREVMHKEMRRRWAEHRDVQLAQLAAASAKRWPAARSTREGERP